MQVFESTTSEKILHKMKKGEWTDILNGLCDIRSDSIVLNYNYFKHLAKEETYSYILIHITNIIDRLLMTTNELIVHVNMKSLSLTEIDKHKMFIQQMSQILQEKYPDKLSKCYIYNSPFIFSQIFNFVSMFVDKETLKKIEIV